MKVFLVLPVILGVASAASLPAVQPESSQVFRPEGRIVGGEPASLGMFPYQVGLLLSNGTSNAWCGGCLISKDWVLTAAHCTYGRVSVIVSLGAVKRTDALQAINSREFHIHEGYSPSKVYNDISLIKLSSPAVLSDDVQPAVLPRRYGTISNYHGDTAIASGWGRTSDTSTSVSDDLNFIFREVTPNSVCAYAYGFLTVDDAQLCVATAGEGSNKSTCSGDSGGPLVVNDYQRTLIGLTSYGHKNGCDKGYPVVFTRVTSHLEWIRNISGVTNN